MLKRGEKVILTEAGIHQGLSGRTNRQSGIVTTDEACGFVYVRRIGDMNNQSRKYDAKFWQKEDPESSPLLKPVMCPGCKEKPHVLKWKCGHCDRDLKENVEFIKPTWNFCPWCGEQLIDAIPGGSR